MNTEENEAVWNARKYVIELIRKEEYSFDELMKSFVVNKPASSNGRDSYFYYRVLAGMIREGRISRGPHLGEHNKMHSYAAEDKLRVHW